MATKTYEERRADMKAAREERGEKDGLYHANINVLEESTLKRELAPFAAVRDNYPKILLTLDTIFGTADYDGVKKRNVIDWLLE